MTPVNLHESNPRFITENNFQPEKRVLKRVIVDTYLIFLYTKLQVLMKNISFTPYQLFEKRLDIDSTIIFAVYRLFRRQKLKRRNRRPNMRPIRRPVDMLDPFIITLPTNLKKQHPTRTSDPKRSTNQYSRG